MPAAGLFDFLALPAHRTPLSSVAKLEDSRLHRLLGLGVYSPQGTSRRSLVRYTEMSIVLTSQCPDPAWSIWVANDTINEKPDTGAWCCKPDYKGVYRDNGTANYFCTATTITTLQPSYYWAHILTTTSCSVTGTPVGFPTAASTAMSSGTTNATFAETPPATASSTGTRPESTNATSPGSQEPAGISLGAKVGAAVGCVAGAALIVAGILYIRNKKQKTIEGVTLTGDTEEGRGKPAAKNFHKSGGRRPSELETVERTVELDGVKPTYELDATRKEDQFGIVSPMSTQPNVN
ncbi:hypothetical protein CORC01_04220 [Colletotrichum orchidophilum]|uniref:Uncharacterized protein n=1 Tax=Colletotrichum orchidophilum TaxID=1209926 RepID=A0A1G4BG51_9PEZI|nr:uncharacterized protein CORC01_04220 [Colletotrichum orchidophilum]OHF00470.1 hypothetical protein CORC01_04220 [Colletotrichum orchidophilum]